MINLNNFKYASSKIVDIEGGDEMDKLFENLDLNFKSNTVIRGKIIETNKHYTLIDIGFKTQGRVDTNEFKTLGETPEIGEIVEVYIVKLENRQGEIVLSRINAKKEIAWQKILDKHKNNQTVKGVIEKPQTKEKGQIRGYTVRLEDGIHAFLPESHADLAVIESVKEILNTDAEVTNTIEFKILKLIKNYKNVLVSRKMILQNTDSVERTEFLEKLKEEGLVITGIIKNITEYGVFVDLKYIDGLLYMSDISWKKIHHPNEVIKENQRGKPITVKVIKFDEEKQKVHLSLKELTENPWDSMSKKIQIGEKMTLKVVNIKNKDSQILFNINEYIQGVMPKEEISWNYNEQNSRASFNIGQEVNVVVYNIDDESQKIMLSQRKLKDNPWIDFIKNHQENSKITAKVHKITNSDIILTLNEKEQLFGYLPFKNLSWKGNGKNLASEYFIGQSIEAMIQSANAEDGKVILSIKHLSEDPYLNLFNQYQPNSEIQFTITRITSQHIYGKEIKSDIIILIPRSEQFWQINEFKSGEKIKGIVLETRRDEHMIIASIKAYQDKIKSSLQKNRSNKVSTIEQE